MTSITCIYATARPSEGAMIDRPDDHIKLFLDSLAKQTLAPGEFEAIIADCYFTRRKQHIESNTYLGVKYPFDIHHFQVKSPWLDRGLWTGQAPWNQAALLASGEHLCLFGDCCEPPPEYLERVWYWYQHGYWAMGLVMYKTGGRLAVKEDLKDSGALGKYKDILGEEDGILAFKKVQEVGWDLGSKLIRDSRWPFIERVPQGIVRLKGRAGGEQFHGYSSIPLNIFIRMNGFDENFDGDKALGDCDMGIRLNTAGYSDVLLIDKDLWIYENAHYAVPEAVLFYKGPTLRSNYSLMLLNEEKKRWMANAYKLTEEDVDWICEHAKDWGFKDIDQKANPLFQWWWKNPPMFDLQDLRWTVQDKLEENVVDIPRYYI